MSSIRPALVLLALFTVLTGGLYPLVVTAAAQVLFSDAANGSLIDEGAGGSRLIGQAFREPRYFWSRPSATAPTPYNAASSSGSNLGPLNPALEEAVKQRVQALREADPGNAAPVPVDLVTASGSGLDPHISPAAAYYQLARVARVRKLDPRAVQDLIERHTEPRSLGVLGEPRVNVLALNMALDQRAP
ncbi:MAG TPA: potassium-transporting ATPase subunit KdpC [Polyangiales bacterium]